MAPDWLASMRGAIDAAPPAWFAAHPAPPNPHRSSAVLVLLSPSLTGPPGTCAIVLTERAHSLRSHAAQVVFPGGHVDPGETSTQAALRESTEEVGLNPGSVDIVGPLPGVYLTPQRTALVPVLGWWRDPHPIGAVDAAEVARVLIPSVADLAEPANRFTATAPGGFQGPGFLVDDLVIWGVTANLLDAILDAAGLSQPWDTGRSRAVPNYLLAPYSMG
ncbi:MAG: CoA pyrophosphatase [Micrococcales bacterium]|nr:CoA pyrophosphatase [Micrococcales bacterium]